MKFTLIEILKVVAIIGFLAALLLPPFINRRRKAQFANVGEGVRDNGKDSLLWDTTTASTLATVLAANSASGGRFLLVKKSTDGDHITTCTTGDVSVGICEDSYDANNTDVPVNVAVHGGAPGIRRVVTDGTVTDGVPVKPGTSGQCTPSTTADAGTFGRAYIRSDETSAAGDVINVITVPPFKYAF